MLHESICSGMISELVGMEALGMHYETMSAADTKTASRTFILREHSHVAHIFTSMEEQTAATGFCTKHQRHCSLTGRPDLVCGGLPCQPFSQQRQHSGGHGRGGKGGKGGASCPQVDRVARAASSRLGQPEEHPSYGTVMTGFFDYLAARQPRVFLIEETTSFGYTSKSRGESFLAAFGERAVSLGYAVRAMSLDHGTWCEMPRPRTLAPRGTPAGEGPEV